MGVMIAVFVIVGLELNVFNEPPGMPGLLLYAYIMFLLGYVVLRDHITTMQRSQIKDTLRGVFNDGIAGAKAVPGIIAAAFAGAHLDPPEPEPGAVPEEDQGVLDAEDVEE